MTLPNFMIIGAAKAGTSALYRYLKQHPEVYMSPKKEPHYFSFNSETKYTKGPGDTIPLAITEWDQYQALFDEANGELAIGEASTTYLYVPGTAERIKEVIPEVKLVAILRQPIDRAYSAFMHVVRDGREPIQDFVRAIGEEERRVDAGWEPIWHYIRGGYYSEQLARYYRVFASRQIKVFLYDDFVDNPLAVLRGIFSFLGVDSAFIPDTSARPNVSGVPRSRLLQRCLQLLFDYHNPVKKLSRRLLPEEVRWRVTTSLRNMNLRKVTLDPALRRQLTLRYYRQEILKLQDLLARDLTAWLE